MLFEVNRQNFRDTRTANQPAGKLTDGQIRLAVERFAFTTNNITYAVAGDMLDYWGFFPTEAPWGRIPAIGLGTVVESAHPGITAGGRYFGFYPMGTELVIDARPHGDGFRDIGPHRANHAATYTDFRDISEDQSFRADQADEYLLLWGMFMTSFLVDDHLADNNFHGAARTLVTSASSKTSISLAQCLALREDHRCVGVTSGRNRSFVEQLGLYDEVLTYDEIDQLDPAVCSGLVDMAGSASIRSAVHTHFGEDLAFSLTVGATHWEEGGDTGRLPGPKPEFFFAPGQRAKRVDDWGAAELDSRIDRAFRSLVDQSSNWLTVEHRVGPDGIEATYRDLLEGSADPASGFVCSMNEGDIS
ncbi:MAG: DUF2855 family protein [Actinomycetia bacterium]|nr:DUF2855 family protein [Actinomycetes bacterium]